MCGIAGLVGSFSRERAQAALKAMLAAQVHRGPDDEGGTTIALGQSIVGLGNRRLAIVDLSPSGHQPMVDQGSGTTLVYNGECYNAPELRRLLEALGHRFAGHSDTEVALRAYVQWGSECLEKLKGMYALAIWDAPRGRLVLARDHLGIKPLYYAPIPGGGLVFASELRALLASGAIPATIDQRAVAGYLAYGAVQEPLTIIEGVRALPPGSWIEADEAGRVVSRGRHWNWPQPGTGVPGAGPTALVEEGRELLGRAVKRHLISDVPLAAFLSSGLDSTAVLGLARQAAGDMRSFTVTFPDDPRYDEGQAAREAASRLGVSHYECPVSSETALQWARDGLERMDQPSMDGINTYIVSKAVRQQGIVVALSGQGGDEVFGGYRSFREVPAWHRSLGAVGFLPAGWRAALAQASALGKNAVARGKMVDIARAGPDLQALYLHFRRLHSDEGMHALGLSARELRLTPEYLDPEVDLDLAIVPGDPVATVGRLEMACYLRNTLLRDGDVFGMANSLEIRVPFLDRDVVEWALRVPGAALLPPGAPSKHLLRQIAGDFYGTEQLQRGKRGFTLPFAQWLQGPLHDLAEGCLDSLKRQGIVDAAGVDRVYRMFQKEPQSAAWSRVWALAVLGRWLGSGTLQTGKTAALRGR